MIEVMTYIMWLVNQPWFGTMVVGPVLAFGIDRLLKANRKVREVVAKVMLEVEKYHPEFIGKDKRDKVVKLISERYKFIPASLVEVVIDVLINEMKKDAKDVYPNQNKENS